MTWYMLDIIGICGFWVGFCDVGLVGEKEKNLTDSAM